MKSTFVVLAILFAAPDSEACSCAQPAVEVMPKGGGAPTNTRIRLFIPDTDVKTLAAVVRAKKGTTKTVTEGKGKKRKTRTVVLPAPAIAMDRIDVGAGPLGIIELVPREELEANTDYVVALQVAGGREDIVGEFETGSGPDTTAPAWNGVTKAVYAQDPKVCCTCSTGDPYATLTTSSVDEGAVLYGVWLEAEDGKIHYDRAPLTYVRGQGSVIKLGRWSQCLLTNFLFPDAKRLVIGVRAFDLAGNVADTAGEVVLDLVKPTAATPPAN